MVVKRHERGNVQFCPKTFSPFITFAYIGLAIKNGDSDKTVEMQLSGLFLSCCINHYTIDQWFPNCLMLRPPEQHQLLAGPPLETHNTTKYVKTFFIFRINILAFIQRWKKYIKNVITPCNLPSVNADCFFPAFNFLLSNKFFYNLTK